MTNRVTDEEIEQVSKIVSGLCDISVNTELLVKTHNRKSLDSTLQAMGGLVSEHPEPDGTYAVRALSGDIGFLKFAIIKQGYAEFVGEREIS